MIDPASLPVSTIKWESAVRIVRSIYPPIDLFEDIADPADWPLLISAEQKTNPRLMENIGNLELVPKDRRVGGQGATYLMAPFCHVSPDRKSSFSDGRMACSMQATYLKWLCWKPSIITSASWRERKRLRVGLHNLGKLY